VQEEPEGEGQATMAGTVDQFTAACAEALFTSGLSARRPHSRAEVETAIRQAIANHKGVRGCTAEVAAAYGDNPEIAARRMCWARAVAECIRAPEGLSQPGGSGAGQVPIGCQTVLVSR
jgi:hypothetical protein